MKKKRNTRLNLKFQDILLIIVSLIGLGFAVYLFQEDLSVSLKNDSAESVGVIYFKRNTAQRRFSGRNLWEQLKESSPVYDGDRIRTAGMSEAYTVFNDGTTIELHENTLIQINSYADKRTLDFIEGSISVAASSAEEKIAVRTGDKILDFSQNASAVIQMPSAEEGKIQTPKVAVTSGEVKLVAAPAVTKTDKKSADGKEIISSRNGAIGFSPIRSIFIPENKKQESDAVVKGEELKTLSAGDAIVYDSGASEEDFEKKENTLFLPAPVMSVVKSNSSELTVPFFWNYDRMMNLEFSTTPDFSDVFAVKSLDAGNQMLSVMLDFEGIDTKVFWRITDVDSKVHEIVQSGVITVREEDEKEKEIIANAFGSEKYKSLNMNMSQVQTAKKLLEEKSDVVSLQKIVDDTESEKKILEAKKLEEENLRKAEEARIKAEAEAKRKAAEEARIKAEAEAKRKAAEEAKIKAEAEAKRKAAEQARIKAEEEAKRKAAEEAKIKAEAEAKRKAAEQARIKAEEEAKHKATEEARIKAEEEAKRLAEEEARIKAEEEAKRKAAEEARIKAEEEARRKAEEEARIKAEEEAKRKAAEEARIKAEEEAKRKAEEEARIKAEEEAKRKAEEEARRKAEEEARRKAEEEARIKAEEEARRKAEEEARIKAEEEARRKAEEEERIKAEEEAKRKAEEEARIKAEEEARRKAEEEARIKVEEEARRKAEEEARIKAEEEARRKAEVEARRKAEEERIKAEAEAKRRAEEELRKAVPVLTVPVLISPAADELFTEERFNSDSPVIEFNWMPVENAGYYIFTLYQNVVSDETKIAAYKVKGTNFTVVEKHLANMENGTICWTVAAVAEKNGNRYTGKIAQNYFRLEMEDIETVTIDTTDLLLSR